MTPAPARTTAAAACTGRADGATRATPAAPKHPTAPNKAYSARCLSSMRSRTTPTTNQIRATSMARYPRLPHPAAIGESPGVPYHRMSDDEVWEFLAADPPHTGKLATTRADGRPHVAPVWLWWTIE